LIMCRWLQFQVKMRMETTLPMTMATAWQWRMREIVVKMARVISLCPPMIQQLLMDTTSSWTMVRVLFLCPPMTSAMGSSYIFWTSTMTTRGQQGLHWSFGKYCGTWAAVETGATYTPGMTSETNWGPWTIQPYAELALCCKVMIQAFRMCIHN